MAPQSARPKIVTTVALLIIVKAALLAYPNFLYLIPSIREQARVSLESQGYSFAVLTTLALFGAAVRVVCAVALLRGQLWGRLLYTAYIPAAYLLKIYLYRYESGDLIGILVYGVFVILLNRSSATVYLSKR
jgi:hypothetical protein